MQGFRTGADIVDASHAIAEHALGLRWNQIPDDARAAAATFLHDTLCVGIAGARAPHVAQLLAAVTGWSAGDRPGTCMLLGRTARLAPTDAAFVNAFQIHAQEYDCVHEPAVVHPLATIVAVLLAELDRGPPRSGAALLTALIAGVDVAAGLGLAATTPLRFFRPATAGIFGSVAALASLRGMAYADARNALGHALGFAAGTMQAHVEATPTLPLQIAQAARSAIQAADLAAAGLPGPWEAIEGPFGYLSLFEAGFAIDRMRLGLGHRIGEVSWKPFPTGRAAHGGIVAVQVLMRDHGVSQSNLAALSYRAPPLIGRLVGRPAVADMTPAYARLCFPWLAAVVLRGGTVTLDDFTDARRRDPKLLELARRVRLETDGNLDPAAFTPAVATAFLHDGSRWDTPITAQFGSPARPLDRSQHLAKARACLAFAGLEMLHDPIVAAMAALPGQEDARVLFNAVLRPRTH
jgi:2-methylcitrate dehydratase PrpD